jgi:hypothetical protein
MNFEPGTADAPSKLCHGADVSGCIANAVSSKAISSVLQK